MKYRISQEVKESYLNSLRTIISYPSVLNEGENGTPFGQAIQDVLEKTLEIAQEMGFQTYLTSMRCILNSINSQKKQPKHCVK